ncbi:K02A2.6-like [Cordylochernes scorpioides]|uniref:RNA-directed DNA polymerase n=1 Tax=Cordylochernes scorpioides TaxID=51811 RepID=A0ABY6KE61_9ARAC|nr:K02A2.6-like [Cordylochernes scorpioides]
MGKLSIPLTIGQISRRENFHVVNAPLPFGILSINSLHKFRLTIDFNKCTIFQLGAPLSTPSYHFNKVSNVCTYWQCQAMSQRPHHTTKSSAYDNHCVHSLKNTPLPTCPFFTKANCPFYMPSNNQVTTTSTCKHAQNAPTQRDNSHTKHIGDHTPSHNYHMTNPHNELDTHTNAQQNPLPHAYYNTTPNTRYTPQFTTLLQRYTHIFTQNKFNVPCLRIPPVKIPTNSEKIITIRPYRVPICDQQEIRHLIQQMLENGIIEQSFSPFSSPVTLVTKRDKTKRFCIDYRKVNELISSDVHPLPRIEDILDRLAQAKYFSTADISSAYWQVPIHPDSRPLLAFTTLEGLYQPTRLPFGLKTSPQIYERAISQQSIDFLGYTITAGTITPLTRNTDIIHAIKQPHNRKTLQSFLGAVNVYNKFIPEYARLRAPLNNLLKKDVVWNWNEVCQKAFIDLKGNLTQHPILHLYKEGLPCQVYCDASTLGIAGILKQVHPDGNVYPVQYFSRTLRPHKKNYSISELECLAIVESVEKFRIYLMGRKFTIFSDHHALQWLKTIKNPSGRLFRWSLRLSSYEYEVRYIKGKLQYEADLLSRNPFCGFLDATLIKTHQPPPSKESSLNIDHNGLHTVSRKGVTKIIIPKPLIQQLLQTANGLCERLNATLTGKLRLLHLENPKIAWTKLVKRVTIIYNKTPHSTTGFPPIYLMFGILPPELSDHSTPYPDIDKARKIAHTRTQNKHLQDKNIYDQRHKQPHFEVGDLVLVKLYHHPNTGKLAPYFTGPHTILEIISPNVVRIDRPNQPLQRDNDTIHVNKLKLYTEKIRYISPPAVSTYHIKHNPNYTFPFKHLTPELFPTESLRFKPTSSEPFRHLDPAIFATRRFASLFPDVKNCKPDNQFNHITPLPKDIKQENCEPTNHLNSTINKMTQRTSTKSLKRSTFDTHFIGKRNVVYERALFGLRSQRPEETIEEFVTVLHRISEHCEYANLREELIRDRLVLGVKDRKLSEKLMLNENLTLAKAVEIARQWEAVMREQQDLNPSTSQVDTTRKVAKQKPKASGHGKDNGRSTSRQTDSAKETDEGKIFPTCFNCGTTKHHYRYRDKCPAKDKVCGKCGKKGHYTNLCRRKDNEVNAISSEETPAREKFSYVYAVREPTLGSRKSRWKSTVRVNGTAIHFKLDPGSDVTLIPFSLYKRYFSNVQLTPTDGQLMAAANQRLENAGTFVAKLRANTRKMKETVYVVHHLEQPLLGVGACEDLQLVKRIDLVINGTTDVNPEREFPKLFEGLGLLEQPYHIKLKEGAKPFSIPVPRRVPLPLMPKLKEQLDAMVAQEVIEPVYEPTICVDLSRLNLSVERELHPLPVLEHELAQLNGAKIFSRLDANSGFWQNKLSEQSQTLTTFITPFGRYKFKRLPFGISSAPEHFQKRMSAILRGVNGVICHMDDILIFAKRKEEHDETLREVLRRLKNSVITLNKEKCQFGVSNVTFLGHYIDEHGIKADEKKVKAIAEMKPPTDVHGVQRFMGMVNFLGRFVPNLAEITKPLNDLRKKDVSFIWGSPQKKAFEKVKDVLASDRVLASFDISKKTMVSADASSYGLGAVLKQEHEANEWRPVAFASRTLTKTEQGYAQIEKEALAITWACERFKDFVVGKTFLIETDHKPLVPIFTTKDLNDLTPRLQRYRMRMLQFSFHIFHTPGKDLITAYALSRQPLPGHLPEDEELQEEVEHFVRSIVLHQSTTDDRLAKIALNQKLEPTLQNVAFYSKNGWPAKCQLSPLERSFYDVRDEIGEENGLLMRGLRVIIPSNMRKDVLNRIHAGHQGITKCRARAKDHVWWPGIGQEIQDMVKTCEKCIENQPLKHEPLIPNDFPERPWQKVGMDLFHYEGSEYLVVVNYFSRFIEVVRLTKLSSEAVVDHCKAIFARHGIPDIVISDNGPQFRPSTTSAFTKFASEVGFRHITSSPKHPQSNGQAEAAVKIVKNLMKKNKDPVLALMEYRATPLANGLSPAELLFGRKIRTMGEEERRKMAQKTAFDRRHAATKKAELIAGEKVWVKDLRAWGSVIEKASAPRSYIVETPVGTYRRNSLLLASSQQQVDPSETSPDSELPAETEETPGNELPAAELQQLPAIAPEIKQLSPSPGKVSRYGRRYKRVQR